MYYICIYILKFYTLKKNQICLARECMFNDIQKAFWEGFLMELDKSVFIVIVIISTQWGVFFLRNFIYT